jgi:predicted nucleotidyltransferase
VPIKDIDKQRIITIISMFLPNAKIYLFGSYARGDFRVGSDLDIAIDNGEPFSLAQRGQIINMIDALNLIQEVDVVDVQSLPDALRKAIKKEGILWKS